jgi:ribosomal protein S18 acetylase RimI-like enzyme
VPVRRARPGDEDVVRGLRVAALTDAPEAFGSTLARELARTPEDWRRWLAPGATFLCTDDTHGDAGLVAGQLDDAGGVVDLLALWVDPAVRGRGAGDALVVAVVAWAQDAGRAVRLHVVEGNVHALALYARNGFRPTGGVRHRANGTREVELLRPRDLPVRSPGALG